MRLFWVCVQWYNIRTGFCENRLDSLSGDSQTVRRGIFPKFFFFRFMRVILSNAF
jgi:hypothetical protein